MNKQNSNIKNFILFVLFFILKKFPIIGIKINEIQQPNVGLKIIEKPDLNPEKIGNPINPRTIYRIIDVNDSNSSSINKINEIAKN